MKKFLVLFLMPVAGLEAWMKTDPEVRKVDEEKMRTDWNAWMTEHKDNVKETLGAGKTKKVTKEGVADTKNNIMLYSIVEAPSHEEASAMFVGHPHLDIPDASIEIMQSNALSGM